MTTMPQRALLIAAATLASGVALGGPANAADPMPAFSGCGKSVKDSPSDATDQVASPAPRETEIEGAFVNAGDAKPTINLIIADLTGSVPPPATSITYDTIYGFTASTTNFVRAYLDFTGMVVFEYGHTEPLATSTRYALDGPTAGKLFTGAHGVVQIEVPQEAGGKAGTTLKGLQAETQLGRTTFVPGAVSQSPSRGLSFQDDTAGLGNVTIGPCAPGTTTGGGTTTTPTVTPPSSSAPPTSSSSGPLPVSLGSKSVKAARKRKTITIKLKSSEPLTAVGVRISKGTAAYGTGKLAKLVKTGKVKVKLTKALKKGSYALDVAGTDGKGARRVASFKLKVK
jgi:hypothetical protein